MRIKVYKNLQDWVSDCEHFKTYTNSWNAAYEAAVGHACMAHPRESAEDFTATYNFTTSSSVTRPVPMIFRGAK